MPDGRDWWKFWQPKEEGGVPQWPDRYKGFGLPNISAAEYKNKIQDLLIEWERQGLITGEQGDKLWDEAFATLEDEGLHSGLPGYYNVVYPLVEQRFKGGLGQQGQLQYLRDKQRAGTITPNEVGTLREAERQEKVRTGGIEAQARATQLQQTQFGQRQLPLSPTERQQASNAYIRQQDFLGQEQGRQRELAWAQGQRRQQIGSLEAGITGAPGSWIEDYSRRRAIAELRAKPVSIRRGFETEAIGRNIYRNLPIPPRTPPTPGFLPEFAPSLEEGKPIQKTGVTFPSAQRLGQMPWEQRQKLASYVDWAGGQGAYRGRLQELQRTLPREPRLGTRWSPTRIRR